MEKRTKIIFKITAAFIFLVVVMTFYNIFILHNYIISFEVPCDPNTESCFVLECDPVLTEDCSIVPNDYYKLIERKASKVMSCGEENFECLNCKENEINCKVTTCDPSTEENMCSGV